MDVNKEDFQWAVQANIIETDDARLLWNALSQRAAFKPNFDVAYVAFGAGSLLTVFGMVNFLLHTWSALMGWPLFLLACGYAITMMALGFYFWSAKQQKIAGGLLTSLSLLNVPLAIYGLEFVPEVQNFLQSTPFLANSPFLIGGLSMSIIGFVSIRKTPFPFMVTPIAFGCWIALLDAFRGIYPNVLFNDLAIPISAGLGVVLLIIGFFLDQKTKIDFSEWIYITGALLLWLGVSTIGGITQWDSPLYAGVNLTFIFVSIFLQRKIFMYLGTIGICVYLSYLSYVELKDNHWFGFVESIIGVSLIVVGALYQENYLAIEKKILSFLPYFIKKWLPMEKRKFFS